MKISRFAAAFFFSLWASFASANVPCTVPFNLQNNTIADATQVMANYNAIVTCLGSAAASGVNNDITALLGLLTPIGPTFGGTSYLIGGTSTGSAAAQVASATPGSFSLTTGYKVSFNVGFSTTGATTLNVNGTGAIPVFRGRDYAVRWYWTDTLRSLWPLLRRAIGKALKWGAVIATVRRLF